MKTAETQMIEAGEELAYIRLASSLYQRLSNLAAYIKIRWSYS